MSMSDSGEKPQERWLDRIKSALGLTDESSVRENIEDALQEPEGKADFSPKERLILVNVLGMRDVRVADVMTPRARIVGVSEEATITQLLDIFRNGTHARLPVYGDTLDDPKGMIHIRDVLVYLAGPEGAGRPGQVKDRLSRPVRDAALLRPLLFVPPSTPALDLLVRMQSKRVHMALVIDEYGETDGLVTMEDLVEVIVGDIEDEHDLREAEPIERLPDGVFAVSAAATLGAVADAIGIDLDGHSEEYDVDSIGGLVTALAGRVPQAGERIDGPSGLVFEVSEAVPRRIKRLIIRPPAGLTQEAHEPLIRD